MIADGGANADDALSFLSPPGRSDSLGRIGHYEVLEVLGQGGSGIVFRAFDEVLQRVVAVKMLAPQLAATSPPRKRFLREARSSAAVRHENVVQVHAVEEQPLPYLVMDFIPGETLQQRLDRTGPLEVTDVVQIGRQIALGLAAAHAQRLIHRDIKPGNILLEAGPHPQAKITDFGLARVADDASLTQSGLVAGTPMYMAPEQARGETLDHHTDLFSLGSVLYTMITGRPPFRAASTMAVLKRVVDDTPRPIPESTPEAPPVALRPDRGLHAKNPEDRPASAQEVADLLAQGLQGRPADGTPAAIPPRVRARFPRRHWLVALAVLPALLVGLGLAEVSGVAHVRGMVIRLLFPDGTRVETNGQRLIRVAGEAAAVADKPRNAKAAAEVLAASAPREIINSIGMKLVLIPAGSFEMGSPDSDPDARPNEKPHHPVRITRAFYLGTTEVTVGQFRHFVETTGYRTVAETDGKGGRVWNTAKEKWNQNPKYTWHSPGFPQTDEYPVVQVSSKDATAFCNALNVLDGLKPFDHQGARGPWDGEGYRLPTEAEWEHACRAGSATRYGFGDDAASLGQFAWYSANSGSRAHPVGTKRPNALGLYDMHGNVWECCWDRYDTDFYRESPGADPLGSPQAAYRELRGGSWDDGPQNCRSAYRLKNTLNSRTHSKGFRVARVPSSR